jgi:hypothetical protein
MELEELKEKVALLEKMVELQRQYNELKAAEPKTVYPYLPSYPTYPVCPSSPRMPWEPYVTWCAT